MADAKICDRCGKTYLHIEPINRDYQVIHRYSRQMDLCARCYQSLTRWVQNVKGVNTDK